MATSASFSAYLLSGNEDFIRKLTREELCRSMAHVDPSLEISPSSSKDTIRTCARLLRESGAMGSRVSKLEVALKEESLNCDAAESRARSFQEREKLAREEIVAREARWRMERRRLLYAIAFLLFVVAGLLLAVKMLRDQNEEMYYDVVRALEEPRRSAGNALGAARPSRHAPALLKWQR
jgi:hypothetical protein